MRGSGGGARQRLLHHFFSPLKVPAAGSVGSAGLRSSSNTSAGAPFLFVPAKLIVLMIVSHERSVSLALVRVGLFGASLKCGASLRL